MAARFGRAASAVLAALFLLIAALLCYTAVARAAGNPLPTVFGWGNAVVLSGSMEPELPVGSLLLIHREESYEVGEIVTYEDENGSLVTHRLRRHDPLAEDAAGHLHGSADRSSPALCSGNYH